MEWYREKRVDLSREPRLLSMRLSETQRKQPGNSEGAVVWGGRSEAGADGSQGGALKNECAFLPEKCSGV